MTVRNSVARVLMVLALWLGLAPELVAEPVLNTHLAGLAPFVGKTWKGRVGGTDEQPVYDVARWETRLGGEAVRVVNALSDGSFAGEMMIVWNEPKKVVSYYYFTSKGFFTQGTMDITPGKFRTLEKIFGAPDRIAQVEGTGEVQPSGQFRSSSRFLRDGQWHASGETIYHEDSAATLAID